MKDVPFKAISDSTARARAWSRTCFQSIGRFIGLVSFLPMLCLSQIVPNPVYDFEKLMWGDSLSSIKQLLHGRILKEQNSEEQFGGGGAAIPSSVLLSYEDTLKGKPFRVVMWFSKVEQKLSRVLVALIRPKSTGDQGKTDEDAIQSAAWELFSERYGAAYNDGSLPLVGKTRMWSFSGTDVFMMSVNGLGKKNFTITYSQNRKQ